MTKWETRLQSSAHFRFPHLFPFSRFCRENLHKVGHTRGRTCIAQPRLLIPREATCLSPDAQQHPLPPTVCSRGSQSAAGEQDSRVKWSHHRRLSFRDNVFYINIQMQTQDVQESQLKERRKG